MNKFIFDLIVEGEFYELPEFDSQKELEDYLGEKCPVEFDSYSDDLYEFVNKWLDNHKLSVVSSELYDYDLEKGYVIQEVVYTMDGRYYRMFYTDSINYDSEVWQEPYEVYPVEETVTITKYYAKEESQIYSELDMWCRENNFEYRTKSDSGLVEVFFPNYKFYIIPKKEIGNAIKHLKSKFPQADGKMISNIVKEYLV